MASQQHAEWRLGQTSERYESGGRGPGVISSGRNDHGGASYGTYQLSSKTGTLREYLLQSRFGQEFDGLEPATPAFDAKWRQLAQDPEFGLDQHEFIRRTHYDMQRERLAAIGLDLSARGPAVQDALWSTSVQFRNRTKAIFFRGLAEKFGADFDLAQLSDSDIVGAVQDYKINHNATLFASSRGLWPGLLQRAEAERVALLRLSKQLPRAAVNDHQQSIHASEHQSHRQLHIGQRGEGVRALQATLAEMGYVDRHGRPLHVDGDFGPHTEAALKAFQLAHGLPPVGHVGPQTQAALEYAKAHGPAPVDPVHPDHVLQQQISRAVDAMEHARGRAPDGASERLKANLLVAAREHGLTRVDHVVLSEARAPVLAGQNAFAVQGRLDDPASRRVHVSTQQALATPVDASWARLAQLEAQPAHAHAAPQRAHALAAGHGEHGAGWRRVPAP